MATATQSGSKGMMWTGRILSTLPVLLLIFSAAMKLMKSPDVIKAFTTEFGYPESMIFTLGIVEICCTVLYVIPQTAVLGAILLTGYLGGAVATHARVGQPVWVMPLILGVVVWLGLFLRDRRLRELIPLRRT